MTALVLDTGALIALDRNDRAVWAMLRIAADDAATVQVPAGAIAQAWRDGRRQALLSRALAHCDEVALDGPLARAAGLLCGQASTADVIDASVAVAAVGLSRHDDVTVVTSDADDIRHLLSELNLPARIVEV
ncbi:MAG: twitching motility protein PilT [Actinomycetota bacterium]|nr:twitching motility protein PilT [Actinomycetota bacterium]